MSNATPEKRVRRRDPERTREAILEVAVKLLAKDGPEGLSVSEVAQRAGINRGTAYHHFQTREELLKATAAWVSQKICREVFGDLDQDPLESRHHDPRKIAENLTNFAMENPEYGRVWLFQVLSSSRPADDAFWTLYKSYIDNFASSDLAEPGIDTEVHAIGRLVSVFLWPVWSRAQTKSSEQRRGIAERYTREALRLSLHGTMRPEKFPGLEIEPLPRQERSE